MREPQPTIAKSTTNRWLIRKSMDNLARWFISFGGISVILSIALIGFFLFYMVFPMLSSARIEHQQQLTLPVNQPLFFASDDYLETAYVFDREGNFSTFRIKDSAFISEPANFTNSTRITSHAPIIRNQHRHVFGLADGTIRITRVDLSLTYPDGVRRVNTNLQLPYGSASPILELEPLPIESIAFAEDSGLARALTWQRGTGVVLHNFITTTNLLTGAEQLKHEHSQLIATPGEKPLWMGINQLLSIAYVLTTKHLFAYALIDESVQPLATIPFSDELGKATSASFLLGNISVLLGFDSGAIVQVFSVRSENGTTTPRIIRDFPPLAGAVSALAPEYIRRGFAASDNKGNIGFYYSTSSGTRVGSTNLKQPVTNLEMSPRHDAVLAQTGRHKVQQLHVDNQHPEVSFASLWRKIWYEFYPAPAYVWQSSSGSSDFEPKLSLAPLTFGTLKAAFYAMLLAVPIAITGAMYTAFFLSRRLRQAVKPVVELMEALPTVILGFLAGLWLAPYIEKNLAFLFSFVLLLPPITIAFGFGTHWLSNKTRLPQILRRLISEEWRVVLIIPVILLLIILTQLLQHPLENALFGGSIRDFISNDLGIGYDQRNSIIIGLALGFAVIPSIFSITEDAIFAVPQNLVSGSLALGASRWQTLLGVVLPSASPGIFSAVMIGLGRAVGETMIVLMATGNTPIMNWNIFEGLRTLAANIAVEMPESAVGSSHFRILFFSGLVLFLFTFAINTLAEVVRQNLRKKYGS